jgi:3-oxoacyl-[acyl-carrier-protein] synthase II
MTNQQLKRVVITGLGAITPIGNNLIEYWDALIKGKNGIDLISLFDASQYACKIAGEVKGFDPHQYMEVKEAKRMARFSQFAVATSKQALADAALEINSQNAEDVGINYW